MRTDGDQWDITSSVGATALGVAAGRAVESQKDRPLVEDPYAQAFVDDAGMDVALPGTPSAQEDTDEMWSIMSTYMGVRTRFFDEFFADATTVGVRQVVLLAAGLDARAFRLPWPDGVTVYEIDQEAVLRFKDEVLEAHDATATVDRVAVTADLRDDWPAALRAAGFDAGAPTAWLAEGLLPYLPPEAETLLFERVQELSVPGSRIAVEHFAEVASLFSDDPRFARMRKMLGVDIGDLVYTDPRDRTPEAHLAELGWKTLRVSVRDLAVAYRRPLDEELAATMGEVSLMSAERLAD